MDAALLAERAAFKRRALAQPAVEARAKNAKKANAAGAQSQSAKARMDIAQMKAKSSGGSGGSAGAQYRFSVLAKIVRHMKARHLEGEGHPLRLEELLDETNQLDVSARTKTWLQNEALKSNPKIEALPDGTYVFKPPYQLTNKKSLLKLLRQHDLKGQGGIFLEDVQESLPKCEKIVRLLMEENKIIIVLRSSDKKKIMFYHDHSSDFEVEEEFQKLWRSVAVDSLDDAKIDEYLEKQGLRSMQDLSVRKVAQPRMRKKAVRRKNRAPKDNEHLKDVLEDYNDMTAEKGDK